MTRCTATCPQGWTRRRLADARRRPSRRRWTAPPAPRCAVQVEAMVGFHDAGVPTIDYGNNIRQMALEEGFDRAFAFPGFVPAYIRPLFCRGIGPFRWAALSGDPEDIARTDAKVKELIPDDPHLHNWLDMARERIAFQGLPARICWVGLGERHRLGLAFNEMVRTGELKAPIVIGRDHLDSGSVASPEPRDRGDAGRLGRRLRLAAPQRAPQLRLRRHLGQPAPRRRRRHGLLPARRHGDLLRRHARGATPASPACSGTTRRPGSCATPTPATRSRSTAPASTACGCPPSSATDMRHLPAAGYRAMPWKNGGGITREAAVFPETGDFLWRLSLATVAADGPFSAFPGVDRTLTVLEGPGIELAVAGMAPARLGPRAPFAFPGDVAASARLLGGAVTDFNVMTRRDRLAHRVEARRADAPETLGSRRRLGHSRPRPARRRGVAPRPPRPRALPPRRARRAPRPGRGLPSRQLRGPDMTLLWAETALTPAGWQQAVRVEIAADGRIAAVTPGAPAEGERHAILLPAPTNLHSHAFQRAMAGLTERRGPDPRDSFWTWRALMYRFLDQLTPDDVEAIAAFVQMEMLEAGYAAVAEFHYLHHAPGGAPYADPAEMSARIAAAAAATGIGLTLLPVLYQWGGCDRRPLAAGPGPLRLNPRRLRRPARPRRRGAGAAARPTPSSASPRIRSAPWTPRASPRSCRWPPAAPSTSTPPSRWPRSRRSLAHRGARPVEWLLANAPVDRRWCLIHATQMLPAETAGLAASGAVAGLCPITESSLGDGIFDGAAYLGAGGAFGVGSDSNIRISLSEELRTLEYSQRLRDRARAVLARPDASTGRVALRGRRRRRRAGRRPRRRRHRPRPLGRPRRPRRRRPRARRRAGRHHPRQLRLRRRRPAGPRRLVGRPPRGHRRPPSWPRRDRPALPRRAGPPGDRPLTAWQSIRDEVLRRVRDGTWKPGAPIPNEADLAREFGCARATVNRALRDLAEAGVLERRRRAGTRVAAAPGGRARLAIPLIHRDVAERGGRYGYALVSAGLAPAPAGVRGRLRLDGEAELLHVRALHLADGRPHAFEDRWIDPRVVPAILSADLARVSANEWLVENTPFSAGDMRISAAAADAETARNLEVAVGAPLLLVERTTWRDGQAITFARQFFAPGHAMDLELSAG